MVEKAIVARIRSGADVTGRQGLDYKVGISAESVGAQGLHLQMLTIPPQGRSHAHKHPGHETAIYAVSGISGCWYGEGLTQHVWLKGGEFLYIPPDTPHFPYNPSTNENFVAIIARTDPNEQEHVVLLPELDSLPHLARSPDVD